MLKKKLIFLGWSMNLMKIFKYLLPASMFGLDLQYGAP